MLVRKIKGRLHTADALKIYELAYCCEGAILELGTFEGLSSSVIASAIRNSGRQREFTSVDVSSAHSMAASANLMEAGLINYVELVVSGAAGTTGADGVQRGKALVSRLGGPSTSTSAERMS